MRRPSSEPRATPSEAAAVEDELADPEAADREILDREGSHPARAEREPIHDQSTDRERSHCQCAHRSGADGKRSDCNRPGCPRCDRRSSGDRWSDGLRNLYRARLPIRFSRKLSAHIRYWVPLSPVHSPPSAAPRAVRNGCQRRRHLLSEVARVLGCWAG